MRTIVAIFLLLAFSTRVFSTVEFVTILPNTLDDTNLEYIELRNTGCHDVDISGYILSDASTKEYRFDTGIIILSHETYHIGRPTSKIILNNTDETLYLRQSSGTLVDQFSYRTSTK